MWMGDRDLGRARVNPRPGGKRQRTRAAGCGLPVTVRVIRPAGPLTSRLWRRSRDLEFGGRGGLSLTGLYTAV